MIGPRRANFRDRNMLAGVCISIYVCQNECQNPRNSITRNLGYQKEVKQLEKGKMIFIIFFGILTILNPILLGGGTRGNQLCRLYFHILSNKKHIKGL